MNCPKCGNECDRDEADVGVGVIYGPYGCYSCGWSEDEQYDGSNGPSTASLEHPGWYVDSRGGMRKIDNIVKKCEHFGIDGESVRKVFEK